MQEIIDKLGQNIEAKILDIKKDDRGIKEFKVEVRALTNAKIFAEIEIEGIKYRIIQ